MDFFDDLGRMIDDVLVSASSTIENLLEVDWDEMFDDVGELFAWAKKNGLSPSNPVILSHKGKRWRVEMKASESGYAVTAISL